MRIIITFLTLSFISIRINSQTNIELQKYNVIDFDSVKIETRYKNQMKDFQSERIEIFENGLNVLNKEIINGLLYSYEEKKYKGNNLIQTKYYSKVYQGLDTIGKISKDDYSEWLFYYQKDKLVRKISYKSTYGEISNDYEVFYEYDSWNRLETYKELNKYKGLMASFAMNSTQLDSIYEKKNTSIAVKNYSYEKDYLTIQYFYNDILTGYEKIKGTIDNPEIIERFDKEGILAEQVIIKRNNIGIIEVIINSFKPITPWGNEKFELGYDKIKIEYNKKRNPKRINYIKNDDIIFYDEFTYYAL